jgi:hypothetical protein
MPLTRDNATDFTIEDLVAVHFAMTDQNGNRVTCTVSWDALENRDHSMPAPDVFLAHRTEIEKIASRLFDAGAAAPFVSSLDLNG